MAASETRTPKRIGRYDVEHLLGQGGMGRVWLARDTVLGRRVAIKVLRDDLALPPAVREELLTRMRHEAQAAAAVSHPNIVTLYDMGEDDTLGLFLVFEYVPAEKRPGRDEGPMSMRERLREGPMPLTEVAKLARELGSALSFAHEAGVIHRDVKPENILFSRTGAKIADFGIARIPESNITRANTVLGTPAYTAPEALSKGDFGPPSDQFSLAATLYEAATGIRAFGSDDPIVTAGKVSNDAAPALDASLGTAAQVRALNTVLHRGLAKEPQFRHQTAADLGEAVARAIERPMASDAPPAPTPIPGDVTITDKIEVERTPLSSRTVLAERVGKMVAERPALTPIAMGETPRPSVFIRKKTQRLQNIAVGIALLVIVALVVFGRRDESKRDPNGGAASASASGNPVTTTTPQPLPKPSVRANPAPRARASQGAPSARVEDEAGAPAVSASASAAAPP